MTMPATSPLLPATTGCNARPRTPHPATTNRCQGGRSVRGCRRGSTQVAGGVAPCIAVGSRGVAGVAGTYPKPLRKKEERGGCAYYVQRMQPTHSHSRTQTEQNAQSRGPFFLLEAMTPLWPVFIFTQVESILTR